MTPLTLRKPKCQMCKKVRIECYKETGWCKNCEDIFDGLVEVFTEFEVEVDNYFLNQKVNDALECDMLEDDTNP